MEVDRRSPGRTEALPMLTEGLPAIRQVDGSCRKKFGPHGKLTEVAAGLLTA